ncbi:Iron-binding protein IscA [Nymphon striatum]|nr:Iron-binding protein IscA [Nymphon striatum]
MAITLTDVAADRVSSFLANRGKGAGLRLGIKTHGCSGMAYVMEFADEIEETDTVFEDHGIKIIVDPKSLVYLDGTEMDFAKEGLNEGFKFNNPNESGACGCASAFRELQTIYHPDRFVNAEEQERRLAIQSTGFINEAHETLRSTRLRARYLLVLKGVDFDDEVDTTSDAMFLMHQMEMREKLEDARQAEDPLAEVDDIRQQVHLEIMRLQAEFVKKTEENKLDEAKEIVLKMKFFERLCQEVTALTEKLEDEMF